MKLKVEINFRPTYVQCELESYLTSIMNNILPMKIVIVIICNFTKAIKIKLNPTFER